jgi:hypothetical protein
MNTATAKKIDDATPPPVQRKRCSAPTFRIEVGSVSLRFGF